MYMYMYVVDVYMYVHTDLYTQVHVCIYMFLYKYFVVQLDQNSYSLSWLQWGQSVLTYCVHTGLHLLSGSLSPGYLGLQSMQGNYVGDR